MVIVGIESTAHTFGVGVVDCNGKILSNVKDAYTTDNGGLIPLEVRKHHEKVAEGLFEEALKEAGVSASEIEAIAFSNAPGLAPCLIGGMNFVRMKARELGIPIVSVNHCIAHLEIGEVTGASDPVMLYASGANTQVIAYESGKYRVFGETLDLGVGNFIDTIARYFGLGFPGGPKIQKLAEEYDCKSKLLDLPYSVKGMDVALSGILTNLKQKLEKIKEKNASCSRSKMDKSQSTLLDCSGVKELKEKDFGMDRSIYVVGSEQELHFKQLFMILNQLGKTWANKCYHLSYGMIELPEGKMKSREGTVVEADALMDKMEELARIEIGKRHDLSEKILEKRATQIGLGALKFFILKYDGAKSFLFNPEESISFEGETGPYVQYVVARINSMQKKAGIKDKDMAAILKKSDLSHIRSPQEAFLVRELYNYHDLLAQVADNYKISLLPRYLLVLSQKFSEYYHSTKILDERPEIRNARIALCYCVKTVIVNGMALMGIECPTEM